MLVLRRRQSESIMIDDKTEITVLEIRGNVVRLGITAPRDVSVLRSELKAHSASKVVPPARRQDSYASCASAQEADPAQSQ